MPRSGLTLLAVAAGLTLAAHGAPAQMHQHDSIDYDKPGNCDLCAPRVYLDGAALFRSSADLPSATSDKTTPLVRGRLEIASFLPHVGLYSQMAFTPADGTTPEIELGLKVWALRRASAFNVAVDVGAIDYRQGIGAASPAAFVMRGWSELSAQYRSPLHEITLYAQAGIPWLRTARGRYQVGLSHPLAPYKLHIP
jgi:hypothetical protein